MIAQFIGFYFAGMAVNLTPCVYPMLTVTASLFTPKKASGATIKHSFVKALFYVLGIVLTYSTLGYFAASGGKLFGSALQSPWVLGLVALMMFVLALSMFGLFQLSVPQELLNRLAGVRKANYFGLFLSGMLVGVFAAPCIGPPVLALLAAVANNGDPAFGFWAFFVFSSGLGTPYLLLGTFSQLVTKLPKAGNWLIWVERFFGIILMGFAFWYLSLALHVNQPKGSEQGVFKPYTEQRLNQLIKDHKPVVLDFYAEWCSGCHEMDKKVFSNSIIKAELSRVEALRVDATNIDSPEVSKIVDRFGIVGLPTIIFLDANGQEIKKARVEGEESVKGFQKSLDLWAGQVGINLNK